MSYILKKIKSQVFLFAIFALALTTAVVGQSTKCKKWTYDYSETVRYFNTPLEACKSYVKEHYPNQSYTASVEPTKDTEMNRCNAGDTYIGVVYKRECDTCCNSPTHAFFEQATLRR